jgi:SPP1 family predicted phage head-tail adaptor
MPHIGQCRELIKLYSPTDTIGSDGVQSITWTLYAERWARVEFTSMSEQEQSAKLEAVTDFRVTLRFDRDITEMMRVKYDDVNMQVDAVQYDEKRKWMTLLCRRVR